MMPFRIFDRIIHLNGKMKWERWLDGNRRHVSPLDPVREKAAEIAGDRRVVAARGKAAALNLGPQFILLP